MEVLLVEDEDHKIQGITEQLNNNLGLDYVLSVKRSVRDAVLSVYENSYDLIILDIALPTFAKIENDGESGGVQQPSGGVEILRALHRKRRVADVVIITQYKDVLVSGRNIPIEKIPRVLGERYKQNIIDAILYAHNDPDWVSKLALNLARIK